MCSINISTPPQKILNLVWLITYMLKNVSNASKITQTPLVQAEEMEKLGLLASSIAHDFNNLLTSILGHMSLALMKTAVDNEARPHIERAMQTAEYASALTAQILNFPQSHVYNQTNEQININDVVKDVLYLMGTVLLKDLDIQVNLMNPIPMLKISRSHLQQIIMNLIINAAEAIDSPINGSIVLKTEKYHYSHWSKTINKVGVIKDRPSGDYLILQVSDNGKGMTPETIDNIFNPFFSTKPKGRGLGLATVRDIISAYGGYITVLSQVGEGTVFQIYFPYQPDKYASIH